MEAALKEVFSVHRNVVRGLRLQLHQAEQERDRLKERLEHGYTQLEENVKKLKEETVHYLNSVSRHRCGEPCRGDGHQDVRDSPCPPDTSLSSKEGTAQKLEQQLHHIDQTLVAMRQNRDELEKRTPSHKTSGKENQITEQRHHRSEHQSWQQSFEESEDMSSKSCYALQGKGERQLHQNKGRQRMEQACSREKRDPVRETRVQETEADGGICDGDPQQCRTDESGEGRSHRQREDGRQLGSEQMNDSTEMQTTVSGEKLCGGHVVCDGETAQKDSVDVSTSQRHKQSVRDKRYPTHSVSSPRDEISVAQQHKESLFENQKVTAQSCTESGGKDSSCPQHKHYTTAVDTVSPQHTHGESSANDRLGLQERQPMVSQKTSPHGHTDQVSGCRISPKSLEAATKLQLTRNKAKKRRYMEVEGERKRQRLCTDSEAGDKRGRSKQRNRSPHNSDGDLLQASHHTSPLSDPRSLNQDRSPGQTTRVSRTGRAAGLAASIGRDSAHPSSAARGDRKHSTAVRQGSPVYLVPETLGIDEVYAHSAEEAQEDDWERVPSHEGDGERVPSPEGDGERVPSPEGDGGRVPSLEDNGERALAREADWERVPAPGGDGGRVVPSRERSSLSRDGRQKQIMSRHHLHRRRSDVHSSKNVVSSQFNSISQGQGRGDRNVGKGKETRTQRHKQGNHCERQHSQICEGETSGQRGDGWPTDSVVFGSVTPREAGRLVGESGLNSCFAVGDEDASSLPLQSPVFVTHLKEQEVEYHSPVLFDEEIDDGVEEVGEHSNCDMLPGDTPVTKLKTTTSPRNPGVKTPTTVTPASPPLLKPTLTAPTVRQQPVSQAVLGPGSEVTRHPDSLGVECDMVQSDARVCGVRERTRPALSPLSPALLGGHKQSSLPPSPQSPHLLSAGVTTTPTPNPKPKPHSLKLLDQTAKPTPNPKPKPHSLKLLEGTAKPTPRFQQQGSPGQITNLSSPQSPRHVSTKERGEPVISPESPALLPVSGVPISRTHRQDPDGTKAPALVQSDLSLFMRSHPGQRRKLFNFKPKTAHHAASLDDTIHPDLLATEDGNKNDREEDTSSRTKAVCEGVGQPSALSQLNASLDPAITLTQYLKESVGVEDHPALPSLVEQEEHDDSEDDNDGDVTLDPRFQRAHLTSGQDVTLISQTGTDTSGPSQPCLPTSPSQPAAATLLDDSFDRVPRKRPQENYAYTEVVRKRAERRKLKGFSCQECQKYYSACGLSESQMQERMEKCSRHRARQAPPSTPEHFWSIGFPETQT